MGNRATTAVGLALAALLGLSWLSLTPDVAAPRYLKLGSAAPSIVAGPASTGSTLVWSFGLEDYTGCKSVAWKVRALQRRNHSLRVKMVYVGSHPEWIRTFVRRERLKAELITISPSEYEREFGSASLPAVHLIRQGVVVDSRKATDIARLAILRS